MRFEPKGIIPAIITPIDNNENINKTSLKKLTKYLIDAGVHGIFVLGTTGEWYGFDLEQKKQIIETVLSEVATKIPVYAGTGAITTRESIELSRMAESIGVTALSVLTPVFIKPSQNELYNHYRSIAESVKLPILLYNNPGRTGNNINVELVRRLSKVDNIVGIKDSSGDLTQTIGYIQETDDSFSVLAGKDTLILSTLIHGGKGAISTTANVAPKISTAIYEEFIRGNIDGALQAQNRLLPLRMAVEKSTFPSVIKKCMELIGIGECNPIRPVMAVGDENRSELLRILKDLQVV